MLSSPIRKFLATVFVLVGVVTVLSDKNIPHLRMSHSIHKRTGHYDRELVGRPEDDCARLNVVPVVSTKDTDLHPTVLCDFWQVLNHLGRNENNPDVSAPTDWSTLCDDFTSLNPYLCPTPEHTADICAHPHPQLDPAVLEEFCEPVLAPLKVGKDGGVHDECVRICVNYVSQDRGNCCALECDNIRV